MFQERIDDWENVVMITLFFSQRENYKPMRDMILRFFKINFWLFIYVYVHGPAWVCSAWVSRCPKKPEEGSRYPATEIETEGSFKPTTETEVSRCSKKPEEGGRYPAIEIEGSFEPTNLDWTRLRHWICVFWKRNKGF